MHFQWTSPQCFLCAIAECFMRQPACLSVCLSICHTRELYQNGPSEDHEIFTVGCSQDSIVFHDKISCPWVRGFPSNENDKEGYPLKDVILPLLARYE